MLLRAYNVSAGCLFLAAKEVCRAVLRTPVNFLGHQDLLSAFAEHDVLTIRSHRKCAVGIHQNEARSNYVVHILKIRDLSFRECALLVCYLVAFGFEEMDFAEILEHFHSNSPDHPST